MERGSAGEATGFSEHFPLALSPLVFLDSPRASSSYFANPKDSRKSRRGRGKRAGRPPRHEVSELPRSEFIWDPRSALRKAVWIAALGATALGSLGRFSAAFALTLGAAVAIVSAFWLADLVGRLEAPRPGVTARSNSKFGLKGTLRYGIAGGVLFGAVRFVHDQVPWLLGGLSTVVVAMVWEGLIEIRRDAVGDAGANEGNENGERSRAPVTRDERTKEA